MIYDVVIIGSGPAGISAALYAKRRKLSVLIISKGIGALEKAEQIENYYGFPNGITGKELYENGIRQARTLDIDMADDEVISLSYGENFEVETVNSSYKARTAILATGSNRITPNIKGIREFEGKGVSYCAICDAFFYKGKDVAVLGNGNYAVHEMEQLKPIANSVTILTNGEEIVENRNINVEVNDKRIREFRGDNSIQEVEFEDGTKKQINGIFVALGTASSNDLARKIGARIENNHIVVDENMQTTVEGLYACGDCTGGLLQINKAIYEGAKAAISIINGK